MLKSRPSTEEVGTLEIIPDPNQLREAVAFVVEEIDSRNLPSEAWWQAASAFLEEYWGDRGQDHVKYLRRQVGEIYVGRISNSIENSNKGTDEKLRKTAGDSRRLDERILGHAKAGRVALDRLLAKLGS